MHVGNVFEFTYSSSLTRSTGHSDAMAAALNFQPDWMPGFAMNDLSQAFAQHLMCHDNSRTNPGPAVTRWLIDDTTCQWNQTESPMLAQARAASNGHTAIASPETVSYRLLAGAPSIAIAYPNTAEMYKPAAESENPESYTSMTDDIPTLAGEGSNPRPDTTTQFGSDNGTYTQRNCFNPT